MSFPAPAPFRVTALPPEPKANAARLAAGWRGLVDSGSLVATAGCARFGVRWGPAGPEDFSERAGRLETGARRRVDGDGLVFQFAPARGARPDGRVRPAPGRQRLPVFEGDGRPCPFGEDAPGNPHSILRRAELARVQGEREWAVLPNLSPYEAAGTYLVVPSTAPGLYPHEPQRLSRSAAADLLLMAAAFDRHVCFFNAARAGASVNHLHLQLVTLSQPLPIEEARVCPDASGDGLVDHVVPGLVFDLGRPGHREALLAAVERLESGHRCYNLLALGSRAWLIGRDPDHEVAEGYEGAAAGYEMAGVVLFTDAREFEAAEARGVRKAFRATTLPESRLRALIDGREPATGDSGRPSPERARKLEKDQG